MRRRLVVAVLVALAAGFAAGWTVPVKRFAVTAWEQVPFHTDPACTALAVNVAVIHDSATGAEVMVIHGSGAALLGFRGADGVFRALGSRAPETTSLRPEMSDGEGNGEEGSWHSR